MFLLWHFASGLNVWVPTSTDICRLRLSTWPSTKLGPEWGSTTTFFWTFIAKNSQIILIGNWKAAGQHNMNKFFCFTQKFWIRFHRLFSFSILNGRPQTMAKFDFQWKSWIFNLWLFLFSLQAHSFFRYKYFREMTDFFSGLWTFVYTFRTISNVVRHLLTAKGTKIRKTFWTLKTKKGPCYHLLPGFLYNAESTCRELQFHV